MNTNRSLPPTLAANSLTLYPTEHAIQEGRYRDALLLLDRLLDVVPEHVEAQHQRLRLYALMDRSVDSIEGVAAFSA